jgi:DNA polymerase III subunit alpha
MNADFTHLHVHTQYSLLDSALRLGDLFKKAAEDKMAAVAMTDHGNLFGAVDFYLKAKSHGIKPILGCEVYVAPQSRLMKATHGSGDEEVAPYSTARSGMSHLILLVQNEIGYLNLCKLVSSAFLEGFYYKPRIDKEILAAHSEGLIATSACLKGEVTNFCVLGDMDRAREAARWYQKIFPGRFYLEMQVNGVPQQMMVNQRFQELAKDLQIPLIATADCHYLTKEDAFAQEVLMAIQTGKTLDQMNSPIKSDEFYFKPQSVIKDEFRFCPDAVSNTMEIARQCNFEFKFTDDKGKQIYHFPKFDPPQGKTQPELLREQALKGLDERLKAREERLGIAVTDEERDIYVRRLERELGVIIEMGFTGYFLIVADFIGAAKDRGIPVGPGRGSGAGSLVAYALKITDLDPIEWGLIFERFLNPERISLPDFDVDFCMDRREEVIQYVIDKYGKDCVAQIITYGKLQARGVIRDVGRAFGLPIPDVDRVAKLVPETLNITLKDAFEQEPRLRQLTETDPNMHKLFEICRSLEGLYRHAGIHAAGVVISDKPMVELCPLYKGKNDELVIQFDMNHADKIGLIKFDFLGLKTLTFLRKGEALVRQRHPEAGFDLDKIDLKDRKMYELLVKGDTLGVFQLESSGMQDLMKKMKPDRFDDIVASNALYRPGPMGSGMLDDFINRKHGTTSVTYDFDCLKPVLEETYGVIVYQEQVQQIAMVLAGYTAGGADLLRRAMGKKKPEEMAKQKKIFLEGAGKNEFDVAKSERLFDLMEKFAGYGFNKSHAAAYSLVTCQTAYLKAHYTVEFFAALLTIEGEAVDKITKYIADAKRHGISVLQPDINQSDMDFTVVSEKEIRFGLGAIKGVGELAIRTIIEARQAGGPFEDLFDAAARCNSRTCNKRVWEAFVKAGALDSFGVHRASMIAAIDEALSQGASFQKTQDDNQGSFLDLMGGEDLMLTERKVVYPDTPKWHRLEELKSEKETIGFFVTGHPLDDFENELKRYTTTTVSACVESPRTGDVMLGAEIISLREIITKRGDRMAFVGLEDQTGQIEAVVFSDVYLAKEEILKSGEPVWIKGQIEVNEGVAKLLLSKKGNANVLPLRHAYEALAREMHVHIELPGSSPKVAEPSLDKLKNFLGGLTTKDGVPVFLHLHLANRATTTLKVKQPVPATREAVNWIRQIFEGERVNLDFR